MAGPDSNSYLQRIEDTVLPALSEGLPFFLAKGKIELNLARGEYFAKVGGIPRPQGVPDFVSLLGPGEPASHSGDPAAASGEVYRFINLLLRGQVPLGPIWQVPHRIQSEEAGYPLTVPLGVGPEFKQSDSPIWQTIIRQLLNKEVRVIGILRSTPFMLKSRVLIADPILFEAYDHLGQLVWRNPVTSLEDAIRNFQLSGHVRLQRREEESHAGAQVAAAALAMAEPSPLASPSLAQSAPSLSLQEAFNRLRAVIQEPESLVLAVKAITGAAEAEIRALMHPRADEIRAAAQKVATAGLPPDLLHRTVGAWLDLSAEEVATVLGGVAPSGAPASAGAMPIAHPETLPAKTPPPMTAPFPPPAIPEFPTSLLHDAEEPGFTTRELTGALSAALDSMEAEEPILGLLNEIKVPRSVARQFPVPDVSLDPPKTPLPPLRQFQTQTSYTTYNPLLGKTVPRPKEDEPKSKPKPKVKPKPKATPAAVATAPGPEAPHQEPSLEAAPVPEPRRRPPTLKRGLDGVGGLETKLGLDYQDICQEVIHFVSSNPGQMAMFSEIRNHFGLGPRNKANHSMLDALTKRVLGNLVKAGRLQTSGQTKSMKYYIPLAGS